MKSVSLENINPHEKDKHISLNESDHIYTIDNETHSEISDNLRLSSYFF